MRKHVEEVTEINLISNTQYAVCVSPNIARKTDLMIYLDINIKRKTIIIGSDYGLQR